MRRNPRYTDSFRQEAASQVIQHGYSVLEVSQRLGVSDKSLYSWIKKYGKAPKVREEMVIPPLLRELLNRNMFTPRGELFRWKST